MSGFATCFASVMCLVVILTGSSSALQVNERIIARWTNNRYYAGKVSSTGHGVIHVLFNGGDRITHRMSDVSAVIPDKMPSYVEVGSHVVTTWKGGHKYYIGYVTDKDSSNRFKVTFDGNDEDYYTASKLRIFPDHVSAHAVGARVFARWTNRLYYRGFVTSATPTTVFINYDGGDTITLNKIDATAVVLDILPCYHYVLPGQRVIGFWPGTTKYYPGHVQSKRYYGSRKCYQKAVYDVLFDGGDQRIQDFNQIRLIRC